ncbi:MAG: PIN/TRAM domain-containing protein [Planctomycetes bacterium]|nr:PIN/TRAM domain-containing protein [Planctomycetota bacterium]
MDASGEEREARSRPADGAAEPGAMPPPPAGAEGPARSGDGMSADFGQELPERRRRFRRATPPRSVSDRVTISVVRGVFIMVMAGLGLQGASTFSLISGDKSPDFLTGSSIGVAAGVLLIVVEALFARSPVRTIAAISFGLLMGLVLSVVFQHAVQIIVQAVVPVTPDLDPKQQSALLAFLNLVMICLFCYFGIAILLATKDDFKFIIPFVEFRKQVKSHMPLVLDTSIFIDGRFEALLRTGVLDQRLEVPRFVLDELQEIADSPDRSMRERGRRGMEILHEVETSYSVEVIELSREPGESVDSALLRLALLHEGKLVTTDFNLTQRARLQGVSVLNLNDLAAALRPTLVAGEVLRVRLQRAGEEPGQAVGFLRDGTMIVVESAREQIGQEVSVEVSSAIQTSAGKMAFGKLKGAGKPRSRR